MSKVSELAKKVKEDSAALAEALETSKVTEVKTSEAKLKANKKSDEKNGLISKSYKLKEEAVKDFANSCTNNGQSQSEVLTALMRAYVEGKTFYKPCLFCRLKARLKGEKYN